MDLAELLKSLTPEELRFIAERDYGEDADLHLDGLRLMVAQGGQFSEGQHWHPYEVVKLTSNRLTPGHEREFAASTLLVLAAVASGYDSETVVDWQFQWCAEDYDKLH